jgi:N-(2-amino-2-carboxyethyl)-L-glutamate synthase
VIEGILGTIGDTPLVRLSRVFKDWPFQLFIKLEGANAGGSIKDRPALHIVEEALRSGEIDSETTVIESSSGNMGIGLAQICAYLGLRFICVIDPKTTQSNVEILKAYGAEIELVASPDPRTGEYLQARIDRVHELLRVTPRSFWSNQYANLNNARAHYRTMDEIMTELGGAPDYLFCATSSCGTLRGCAEYLRLSGARTKLVGVDAVGSAIFGGPAARRLIPGHGAARIPELFHPDLVDESVHVTDLDCVVGCRRLVRTEAILAGGSTGAVLMAVAQMAPRIERGATCVMISPDRGERYLGTIYSDDWVKEHFGEVSELWLDLERVSA